MDDFFDKLAQRSSYFTPSRGGGKQAFSPPHWGGKYKRFMEECEKSVYLIIQNVL